MDAGSSVSLLVVAFLYFAFLGEGSVEVPSRDLFFVTRLAAVRTCLASFSSVKMAWMLLRSDFASESGLGGRLVL